jgi:1-acyl-sn-glycerol-3-phosphate acyltransferase
VLGFMASRDEADTARVRQRFTAALADVDDAEVSRLVSHIASTGIDFDFHPSDELARRLNHVLAELVFEPGSALEQPENCEIARHHPVIFLSNHLSFADANLLEALLHLSGFDDIARRLTVLAGPKVYNDPFRRFASLCFGTIKTPQSPSRASEEAVMDRREVARLAAEVIALVRERAKDGDHLLVFVEGTRSRTASMQPALPAVSRYLDEPDAVVVPLGIAGSERLVPIGEERLHRTRVNVRAGPAFAARRLKALARGNRRLLIDAVGVAIARLLPASYQGTYASGEAGLDLASRLADELEKELPP